MRTRIEREMLPVSAATSIWPNLVTTTHVAVPG